MAVQLCIVHQIRNSVKYVGSKHQKEFMKSLKLVYGAVSKEATETGLDKLAAKWDKLAYRNIKEKWAMPLANRAIISQQLAIKFGDRFEIM